MAKNPTYYDGDLATDLVNAALAVIAAEGPAAVSLRSLARDLGVSHAAPKNHFPDKANLFTAIATAGFVSLGEAMIDATNEVPPARALIESGVAYVAHALGNPSHFAVMWQTDLYAETDAVLTAKVHTYEILLGMVEATDSDAAIDDANRAWALAHGWASLILSGSLTVPDGDVLDYVRRQLSHSRVGG